MAQRTHLTQLEAWRLVRRLQGGQTQTEVATGIGVAQSGIFRIWNRFLETGNASRKSGRGRRRVTTPNKDHYLMKTA